MSEEIKKTGAEKPAEGKEKEAETEKTEKAENSEKAGKPSKDESAEKKEKTKTKGDDPDAALDEEEEENIDELFIPRRISIPLSKENARFFRSKGGLISLDFTNHKGEKEIVDRVVVFRAFPITNPDEFLSVREPDSKKDGKGLEIGMIRRITDVDDDSAAIIREELDRRYFTPTIIKIKSVKEKFGYSYWDTETTSGPITFIMTNPFSNIRTLEDGRIFIKDMDGNHFQIPDVKTFDAASYKKIEVYL